MTYINRIPLQAFMAFWLTVVTVSYLIIHSAQFPLHGDLLSLAVTLDVVLLVPLVYIGIARHMGWRLLLVVPVLAVCLMTANLILPSQHKVWLHRFELILIPFELCLVGFLIYKARAIKKGLVAAGTNGEGFLETLEKVIQENTNTTRPAKIIAMEIAVIYYGVLGWWRKVVPSPDREYFTYHRKSDHGAVLGVFIFIVLIETGMLHWFLLPRIEWLAWVLFALSLYSILFLLADLNSARLRPIYIQDDQLIVRVAMRWRARIPLHSIQAVELSSLDIDHKEGLLSATLLGNHNVVLQLKHPVSAQGIYGFQKTFDRIALEVDDPQGFKAALSGKM